MTRKKAVITAELVDESVANSNETISEDLLKWFQNETVPAPWVKAVKTVVVQRS